MSAIDALLDANAAYARRFDQGGLPMQPARRLVIVTCMDARIDPARAFGLAEGDAHIIRNAGGRASEALRSIVVSQQLVGTTEVAVIHHTGCGLLAVSNADMRASVRTTLNADASQIDFLPMPDLEQSVAGDVRLLRQSPLVVPGTVVRGFVYDVRTGGLREIEVLEQVPS